MVSPTYPVPTSPSHPRVLSARSQVLGLDEAEQAMYRRLRPLSFGLRFDEAPAIEQETFGDLPRPKLPDPPLFEPYPFDAFGAFAGLDGCRATPPFGGPDEIDEIEGIIWQHHVDAGKSLGVAPALVSPDLAQPPSLAPNEDVTGVLGRVDGTRSADLGLAQTFAEEGAHPHPRADASSDVDPVARYTHLPSEPGRQVDLSAALAAVGLHGSPGRAAGGPAVRKRTGPTASPPPAHAPQAQRPNHGLMEWVIASRPARSDHAFLASRGRASPKGAAGPPRSAGGPGPGGSPPPAHRVRFDSPLVSVAGEASTLCPAAAKDAGAAAPSTALALAHLPGRAITATSPTAKVDASQLRGLGIWQPPTAPSVETQAAKRCPQTRPSGAREKAAGQGVAARGATTPLARRVVPVAARARADSPEATRPHLPASPGPHAAPWPLVSTPPVYVTPTDQAVPFALPAINAAACLPLGVGHAASWSPASGPHTPAGLAPNLLPRTSASPGYFASPTSSAPLDYFRWAVPWAGGQASPQAYPYPTTPSPTTSPAYVDFGPRSYPPGAQGTPGPRRGAHLAGPSDTALLSAAAMPPASPSKRRRTNFAGDASPGAEGTWPAGAPGPSPNAVAPDLGPSPDASPAGKRTRTPHLTTPDAATQHPVTDTDPARTFTPVDHPPRWPHADVRLAPLAGPGASSADEAPYERADVERQAAGGTNLQPSSPAETGASSGASEAPLSHEQWRKLRALRGALGLLAWRHVEGGGIAASVARNFFEESRVNRAACEAWADGVGAGLQRRDAADGTNIYLLERPDALDPWLREVGLPAVLAEKADRKGRLASPSTRILAR